MKNTCNQKCDGVDKQYGKCCMVQTRDYILGPVEDAGAFLHDLRKRFPDIEYEDVFIDFEEGAALFPNKSTWLQEKSYPAIRIDKANIFHPCMFYNHTLKACNFYTIRPEMCRTFSCTYLKSI